MRAHRTQIIYTSLVVLMGIALAGTLFFLSQRPASPIAFRVEWPTQLRAVAISQDGRTVVAGDNQGTIVVWEEGDESWVETLRITGVCSVQRIVVSPDGRVLFARIQDTSVYRIERATSRVTPIRTGQRDNGQPDCRLRGSEYPLALSADGAYLALADRDGVEVLRTDTDASVATIETALLDAFMGQETVYPVDLQFVNASTLVIHHTRSSLLIWDYQTNVPVANITPAVGSMRGHQVGISADQNRIITVETYARELEFWGFDGERHQVVPIAVQRARTLLPVIAFSPDGVWFIQTGRAGEDIVSGLPFIGDLDPQVYVGQVEDGTLVTRLTGHQAVVLNAAISRARNRIASIDGDGVLIVWDVESATQP